MKTLFLTMVMALGISLPSLSNAHVFGEDECATVANVMGSIAQARDEGVPAQEVKDSIRASAKEVMGKPGYVMADQADLEFFVNAVDVIYRDKGTPQDVAQTVYLACEKNSLKHRKET